MRTLMLLPLAALLAASQLHAIELGHVTTGDKAAPASAPMAWRYRTLAAGLEVFERHVAAKAPGAALAFGLPTLDEVEGGNSVTLQRRHDAVALPMVGPASFRMARDDKAAAEDARVLTNRQFRPGTVLHPQVQVRSPGLAADTRRLGDLRLACEVQTAMARNDTLGLKAVMAAVSLLKSDLCASTPVTQVDAPSGAFDGIVIDDGVRRVVQKTGGADQAPLALGDSSWKDDTRITYLRVAPAQP